jgi:hypothetical protein
MAGKEAPSTGEQGQQPMSPEDLAEAARVLRSLLALVETGELEAKTPNARAVVRRIEGAAIAAELSAGRLP